MKKKLRIIKNEVITVPEYSLKDNVSIYSEENLGKLEKDFKDFKLQDGVSKNVQETCVKRFKNEKSQLHDHKTEKGYAEDQLDKDPTGLRVKFFRRTLIPILLDPKDEELERPEPFNIDYSRAGIKLEKGASIKDRSEWKNVFDGNEVGYFQKLIDQYEEERKKLDKAGSEHKNDDYDGYGGYGENALDEAENEFNIASDFFSNKHKELEDYYEKDEVKDSKEKKTFDETINELSKSNYIISKGGLNNLNIIVTGMNKKFKKNICGIKIFLDKNKDNLIKFIEKRDKYLKNIDEMIKNQKNETKKKKLENESKLKNKGLLRVRRYATMMLMNRIRDDINSLCEEKKENKNSNEEQNKNKEGENLNKDEEIEDEKIEYEDKTLAAILFKIYKKAQEDYDELKSEYDDTKQSKSNSKNYEDENGDDEKKEEVKKQDSNEKFEVANYLKMFKNDKIASYLVMRVKMRLIEIYLKTNFFGFDTRFDNEKDEKDFEFKKKHVISIIDKQSNLKYTAKQVSDILDKDKNSGEYKNLENYFGILTDNLNTAMSMFEKLNKKWTNDDNDTNVGNVKKIQKDFPVGENDFKRFTNLETLKTLTLINKMGKNKLSICDLCLSFDKNYFDKALKKAEEIRATYGIS